MRARLLVDGHGSNQSGQAQNTKSQGMGSDPRKVHISLYFLFKTTCISTLELRGRGRT